MERRNIWLPLLVVLFIVGVVLKLPLMSALSIALIVIMGVSTWWGKHALDGVEYRRHFHYTRAFPGESVSLRLDVENRKLLPLTWLRVQDPWHKAIGPDDEEILAPSHLPDRGILTNIFSLRWFEIAKRKYNLVFRKRGIYSVGPTRLESGDLFGFFEHTQELSRVDYLTVFPNLIPHSALELPAEDPFGDRRSRRRLFEDPNRPMGVR